MLRLKRAGADATEQAIIDRKVQIREMYVAKLAALQRFVPSGAGGTGGKWQVVPDEREAFKTLFERAMRDCGLNRSHLMGKLKEYHDKGAEALRRKVRPDAGTVKAGGEEKFSEAAELRRSGLHEAARVVAEEGERRARWVRTQWEAHVIRTPHGKTTVLRSSFAEEVLAPLGLRCPSDEVLRRWRSEMDPSWTRSNKERRMRQITRSRTESRWPNHAWLADQMKADLFVKVEHIDKQTGEITWRLARPWLFHFVDHYSRCEVGGVYSWDYDTEAIEEALLDAIYPEEGGKPQFGVPEMLWWDNAKQHKSDWMRESLAGLQVSVVYCTGREPQVHGLIEGSHNWIHSHFEALLPGYVGGDNNRKNPNRPLWIRQMEEEHGDNWQAHLSAEQLDRFLTLDELNERWRAWRVKSQQDEATIDGERTTRALRWAMLAAAPVERRTVPDRERLAWRFLRKQSAKVTLEGWVWCNHQAYSHPSLNLLADGVPNRRVEVRSHPRDPQHCYISVNDELKLIATPILRGYIGDAEHLDQVIAQRREGQRNAKMQRATRDRLLAHAANGLIGDEEAAAAAEVLERVSKLEAPRRGLPALDPRVNGDDVVPLPVRPVEELVDSDDEYEALAAANRPRPRLVDVDEVEAPAVDTVATAAWEY